MVAPLIAALDAAIKVKSLPVMPSRTSLPIPSVSEIVLIWIQENSHVGDGVCVRVRSGGSCCWRHEQLLGWSSGRRPHVVQAVATLRVKLPERRLAVPASVASHSTYLS